MVSAVSSASTQAAAAPSPTAMAHKDVNRILQSHEVLQSLASQTSRYLPPTIKQVLSMLWAEFNPDGSRTVKQSDVQKAILGLGGKASEADALWAQLAPNGEKEVNAA